MTENWSFAKIKDMLLNIEVSDHISKSLSQQNRRCPSPASILIVLYHISAYVSLFKPDLAYSSGLQPISVCSILFQYISTYSSLFQPILPISAYPAYSGQTRLRTKGSHKRVFLLDIVQKGGGRGSTGIQKFLGSFVSPSWASLFVSL